MLIELPPAGSPLGDLAAALIAHGARAAPPWVAPDFRGPVAPAAAAIAAALRTEALRDAAIVVVLGMPAPRALATTHRPPALPTPQATTVVLDRWPRQPTPDAVNFLGAAAGIVTIGADAPSTADWQGVPLLALGACPDPAAIVAFARQCAAKRVIARCALPDDAPAVTRPRLALVTPLPPQATGIADHAARMIPALAAHYAITVVSDTPPEAALAAACAGWITPDAFARCAWTFDRVVYQVGNSRFHADAMARLIPAFPGVVVLHDAALADCRWAIAEAEADPPAVRHAMLAAFGGFGAALAAWRDGIDAAFAHEALLGPVIDGALGVIVHSHHAAMRLPAAYGAAVIAHPAHLPDRPDRAASRAALGLGRDAFVTCSFGEIGRRKGPLAVLEGWLAAPGGHAAADRLVFVGHAHDGLDRAIAARAAAAGRGEQVLVTGRVDRARWLQWLAAADAAVQLRQCSIGESSGAVADCLAAGVPLIVNRHGAMAELPHDAVMMLDACPADHAIGAMIARLRGDPALRRALAGAAQHHAATALAPETVAQAWHDAIERAHETGPLAPIRRLVQQAARLDPPLAPAARAALARAMAATWPPCATARLFAVPDDDAADDPRWLRLLAARHRDVRIVPAAIVGDRLVDATVAAAALFGWHTGAARDPAPPCPGDGMVVAPSVRVPPAWTAAGLRVWTIDDPALEPLLDEAR